MWKSYMVYKCRACGFEQKTDQKIYRFDDDNSHMKAYSNNRDMQESRSRASSAPWQDCGNDNLDFAGWE